MPTVRSLLIAGAVFAAAASPLFATAAQMGAGMPVEATEVAEGDLAALPAAGPVGDCGCRGQSQQTWQQPPWHGNVRGSQCGQQQPCCRGSNVFQAHPFQQLHWKHSGCVTLPPFLPRLHAMCREGYLPSPVPPTQPRCHQCGAAIEGGF